MADEAKRKTWTSKSMRVAYENPWITVRHHEVIAPTGHAGQYGVVHFKNEALGVVPIDSEGCTVLVGQERFVFGDYSWELPEGGGKVGADRLEGAKRELSEEAGLRAGQWLELFSGVRLSKSVTDEVAFAWLAWDLSPDASYRADATEELSVRRVPFQEAVSMAVSGEITDAFSLVMLLKADHLLRTGALPPELMRLMQGRA